MQELWKQIEKFWARKTSVDEEENLLKEFYDKDSNNHLQRFLHIEYKKELVNKKNEGLLSKKQKRKIWVRLNKIMDNERNKKSLAIKRFIYVSSCAACVVILIGIFFYVEKDKLPQGKKEVAGLAKSDKIVFIKNMDKKEKKIMLPDSSVAFLSTGSSINYPERFALHARNINLTGKGLFEVRKDTSRPFTVTAKGFATTALGTRFIVDATEETLSIKLIRGKIVISATSASKMKMQKVYLTEGEELKINTRIKNSSVNKAAKKNSNERIPYRKNNSYSHITETDSSIIFDKASLSSTFGELTKYYNKKIIFNKSAIQGLSFTGSFKTTDNLELSLQVICNINGLTFEKKGDDILINK